MSYVHMSGYGRGIRGFGSTDSERQAFWQKWQDAKNSLNSISPYLPPQQLAAQLQFIMTADRMALAIYNGDNTRATAFVDMVQRYQDFLKASELQNLKEAAEFLLDVLRNIPGDVAKGAGDAASSFLKNFAKGAGIDPASLPSTNTLIVGVLSLSLLLYYLKK